MAMDTAQVTRTVARLRLKGLVQNYVEDGSTKEKRLTLTASGRKHYAEARNRQLQIIRQFLRDQSEAETIKMIEACRRVGNHLWDREKGPFVRLGSRGDFGLMLRVASKTLGRATWGGFNEDIELHIAERFMAVRQAQSTDDGLFLISESWGEVTGGILVSGDRATRTARVEFIAVDGDHQYQGAGTLLLFEAVKEMKARGYRTFTTTQPKAPHGQSLYSRQDWVLTGSRPARVCGVALTLEDWRWPS
jgi:ribosomal protein S18 acetylase RimI-like enzyme